jgi:hypothetical protein
LASADFTQINFANGMCSGKVQYFARLPVKSGEMALGSNNDEEAQWKFLDVAII